MTLKLTRPTGALVALWMLSGCNAGMPLQTVTPAGAPRPDRTASWIAPEAAKSALLYIADSGTYDVNVYTFPALKQVGTLTGFNDPQGECSDTAGNVWITNTKITEIFEFRHGGKNPIKILTDPTGYPVSCAVDAATGNLAVTNIFDFSGAGDVLIYRKGGGTPSPFSNPNVSNYYFAAFDSKSDLYASGETAGGTYILSVLPHGKAAMSTVTIKGGTIYFPGSVARTGSSLVLGDQECGHKKRSCLYEASVSGTTATITGSTPLSGACDVAQVQLANGQIAGGDYQHCGRGTSSVDLWPFPKGGPPSKKVTGVKMPVGAAISAP
jgi:hypothetical protein